MKRRSFVGLLPLGLAVPALARADKPTVENSPLIYVSPLRSDGSESRCQGEVWFQEHEGALYVVTASSAWRATCIAQGLDKARVWVGDVGLWRNSNGRYRVLPQMDMTSRLEQDAEVQAAVLAKMGGKYAAEWPTWGPRFRDGLASGKRVMIRYA